MPLKVAGIRRDQAQASIADLAARWKTSTANNRYRGLQAFFRWLEEAGEIKVSPMAKMKPPKIDEEPPDILREEQPRKLLATWDQ